MFSAFDVLNEGGIMIFLLENTEQENHRYQ
jgi:hypothetical protein